MVYKIILSEHMTKQGLENYFENESFEKANQAYVKGIGVWGSGSYHVYYQGEPIGWDVIDDKM